jgi:hypothetical protein
MVREVTGVWDSESVCEFTGMYSTLNIWYLARKSLFYEIGAVNASFILVSTYHGKQAPNDHEPHHPLELPCYQPTPPTIPGTPSARSKANMSAEHLPCVYNGEV